MGPKAAPAAVDRRPVLDTNLFENRTTAMMFLVERMEIRMVEALVVTEKFPEKTLLATIDTWWVEEQSEAATLAGTAAPTKKPSLMTPLKTIDSHRVVRCILELEPILGVDIPESVIQKGGYDTIAELKADLVEKLKALHAKAHAA